jgi:hypothetical protein
VNVGESADLGFRIRQADCGDVQTGADGRNEPHPDSLWVRRARSADAWLAGEYSWSCSTGNNWSSWFQVM